MATYNCTDTPSSAYGEGSFGTCDTTGAIGAPNTGFFHEIVSGGNFTIIVPLAVAIFIVVIASVVVKLRKKATTTDASL